MLEKMIKEEEEDKLIETLSLFFSDSFATFDSFSSLFIRSCVSSSSFIFSKMFPWFLSEKKRILECFSSFKKNEEWNKKKS
jgi:hypothetical protein